MSPAETELREQVRAALAATQTSQATIARHLGISQKYMSHMMTGRAPLTLAWAERILVLIGMRIDIAVYANAPESAP